MLMIQDQRDTPPTHCLSPCNSWLRNTSLTSVPLIQTRRIYTQRALLLSSYVSLKLPYKLTFANSRAEAESSRQLVLKVVSCVVCRATGQVL